MNFHDESEAIEVLKYNNIYISEDYDILFPRYKHFDDDVHAAIEYLIDEWDFGIKYV